MRKDVRGIRRNTGAQALKRKIRYLRRQQRALSRKVGARKGEKKSNCLFVVTRI